ncbi:MAG: imidazole glycerol phosphate synthase subunit HisH [Clostridiales Family XIII bacterium]|jgi:glutamine amidotransferase|nr:imidazole glycerol phosphate synthase subunit HisH [Clostridiales Family XIII bacterium]
MITIIDYGAGNLFSVKNALDFIGVESVISSAPDDLRAADKLILPGVGSFPDAMEKLHEHGLVDVIREETKKKPLLGICLGMQILFEKGYEFEETDGLGLIPGKVDLLVAPGQKIPHMGWDSLTILNPSPLSASITGGDMVYFVHSYKAVTDEQYISMYTEYGQRVPALVTDGANVYGAQFHPEKSGSIGLGILKSYAAL